MQRPRRRQWIGRSPLSPPWLLGILVALLATVAACQDTSGLTGSVEIDGSSTVFPITEAMAEEFSLIHRGVRVTVGISGTGGGFQRFCAGETDITNASRPITTGEREACAENGVVFIEIPIAFDGLTVTVNPQNDWVDFLSVEDLGHIFRPDDPAERWADVRPGWPDTRITIFSPGADSGSFDYFTETINGESGAQRSADTLFSEDDNVLVIGVSGERDGIAYFGFAFFANNSDRLRVVPIDGGAGPILPTAATINDGSYAPLSRPLFIYVKAASLDEPEVAAFVDFYLTEGRELIDSPEIGYVQLPDALYAASQRRVAARESGSPIAGAPPNATLAEIYSAP